AEDGVLGRAVALEVLSGHHKFRMDPGQVGRHSLAEQFHPAVIDTCTGTVRVSDQRVLHGVRADLHRSTVHRRKSVAANIPDALEYWKALGPVLVNRGRNEPSLKQFARNDLTAGAGYQTAGPRARGKHHGIISTGETVGLDS